METQSLEILRRSLDQWGGETLPPLVGDLERYPLSRRFPEALLRQLDDLGVLRGRADAKIEIDLEAMAEILFAIARHDASVAVLVLEQSLAAELLAAAGRPLPAGWVALPLYDHPLEWPRAEDGFLSLDWRCIPALPIACQAVLPIIGSRGPSLLAIDLRAQAPGVGISEPILPLGFRGCPVADLRLEKFAIERERILLEGEDVVRHVTVLWSQAEALVMAIRSGILHASYQTALEYAGQRYQGGKIILDHSLVRRMLADFHLADERLQASWRGITRSTAVDQPLDPGWMAAALESAVEVPRYTSDGIQLLGGYGYMEEFGQEKRFRDAKQSEWLLGHPQVKRFAAFEQALREEEP